MSSPKQRECQKEYRERPEVKKRIKEYESTPKAKAIHRRYEKKSGEKRRAYYRTPKSRKRKREYHNHLLKTNIEYRLKANLRRRLNHAIGKNIKLGSAVRDLGCSPKELRDYLESKFQPGMSWGNYGNKDNCWSIDHIIPLSWFDLTDWKQFLIANNYTNLQPMWHIDNLIKNNKRCGV
jgi:Uri superfamily endonuclease